MILKNYFVCIALAITMPVLCTSVLADDPPADMPIYYYGWVLVNGSLAADGTQVIAESGGVQVGTATVPSGYTSGSGYYHIYVNSSYSGQTAAFKVRGVTAMTLTLPESGRAGLLNLSVNVTDQTPSGNGNNQGASGSTGTKTSAVVAVTMQAGTTKTLNFTTDVIVLSVSFKAKADVTAGSVAVNGENAKPEGMSTPDGAVYGYLNVTAMGIQADSIKIRFSVSKTWIADHNINKSTVRLNRYDSDWNVLPTILVSDEGGNYLYDASTPGFSIFAVTGQEMACTEGMMLCSGNQTKECKNGAWMAQDCPQGCNQATGRCNALCEDGQRRCSNDSAELCINSTWMAERCPDGCKDGLCASNQYAFVAIAAIVAAVIIAVLLLRKR